MFFILTLVIHSLAYYLICMLSQRCRLLEHTVLVGMAEKQNNEIFWYFPLIWCYGISFFKFFPLKMFNKTVIGLGFCDTQNYQCLGWSYKPQYSPFIFIGQEQLASGVLKVGKLWRQNDVNLVKIRHVFDHILLTGLII